MLRIRQIRKYKCKKEKREEIRFVVVVGVASGRSKRTCGLYKGFNVDS